METKKSDCVTCPDKSCAVAVLSSREQEWMDGKVQRVTFEKGENLFREGALNGHIFLPETRPGQIAHEGAGA
ncbi:MAG: hypothetical protein IPL49_10835 [Saprospirales bacterium]|nr:hypothetical protein [Saprospirales bacterium]